MNTMLKITAPWTIATVLLGACVADVADEPEQEVVLEMDDQEEERTTRQDVSLSACARDLFAKYKDSPYVPLVRWSNTPTAGAIGSRDFMTTDPRYYGCTGEARVDEFGYGDLYHFKGVIGLMFRPDRPPPTGTIPVYGYESTVRGTGGTTNWPDPHRDRCITSNPAPLSQVQQGVGAPTITGATGEQYGLLRVEGYAYSWAYRPTGAEMTIPLYLLNKISSGGVYDCYNDTVTTVPSGFTSWSNDGLKAYLKAEASVTVAPPGECTFDTDCSATQLCYWNEAYHSIPSTRKGPRGFCTQRCLTHSQCGGDFPYCDIEAQRCAQAGFEFKGPAATFSRNSVGSYQVGKDRLAWANSNEPRYEDRGEGFGPQLLIEQSSTNRLIWTNEVSKTNWTRTNLTSFKVSDSPGPHDASMFQRTTASPLPNLTPVISGAGSSFHTVSYWTKPLTYTGTYAITDSLQSTPVVLISQPPAPAWTRLAMTASFDPSIANSIRFGLVSNTSDPLMDSRGLAYVQVESGTFPTSAMYAESSTMIRQRDILSVNLRDVPSGNFSWRMFVWPSFSCTDLKNISATASAKLLSWMDGTERTRITFDVLTGQCNVNLWNSAWATQTTTVTNLDWDRNQMLIVRLASSIIGTAFSVAGARTTGGLVPSGEKGSTPTQGSPLTWTTTTRLDVGPSFHGRVSPPLWQSTDTINGTGSFGPPAVLDLAVTTTNNGATITFSTNMAVASFVDWGTSTPVTPVTGPLGTRHSITISGLTSLTNYVYRIRVNGQFDGYTGPTMAFTTK